MEFKIKPSSVLCSLVILVVAFQECSSAKRLPISKYDRGTCLEKLICGIHLVQSQDQAQGNTKATSEKNYYFTNQVDLIRRYVKLYPLIASNEEDSNASGFGEPQDVEVKLDTSDADDGGESDDDEEAESEYDVDLDDIVHKPKPKPKNKRRRKPSDIPEKKEIFGSTGLPISESALSLTGRLIKTKGKGKPETEDEEIMTQLYNKQLTEQEQERTERALRRFETYRKNSGKRGSAGRCAQISCPFTFKQLYESLEERDIVDPNNNAAPGYTRVPNGDNEDKQVSALSTKNYHSGNKRPYKISSSNHGNLNDAPGLEGFLQAMPMPTTADYTFHQPEPEVVPQKTSKRKYSKKKKRKPLKPAPTTARPSTKKRNKVANQDVVGTIAPPHKTINYRPIETIDKEDNTSDGDDDEVEDINQTFPVKLVGDKAQTLNDEAEDLKKIAVKLKYQPSKNVHHREDDHDDERGSDENHDDYDEEAKYEVQVDYGNDEDDDETDEDDDDEEEDDKQIRVVKPKKSQAPKPSSGETTGDYFQTSSIGKRKKTKKNRKPVQAEAESSEEDQDDDDDLDQDDEVHNINSHVYSVLYSRDSFNIGGRPMTAPGDVPIQMTSGGLMGRQRSGASHAQARPNLAVRQQQARPTTNRRKKPTKKSEQDDSVDVVKQVTSASAPSIAYPLYTHNMPEHTVMPAPDNTPDMSSGLSLSKITAPFQSLFKLVLDGAAHSSSGFQHPPHYQNQRPSAFFTHQNPDPTHVSPEDTLKVAKPAPAPPTPAFSVPKRPVGPESSQFKRYTLQNKKEKKTTYLTGQKL